MISVSNTTTRPATAGLVLSWPLIRDLLADSDDAYSRFNCFDQKTNAKANVTATICNGVLRIVVAFKGSSNPEDFIQDAKFERTALMWFREDYMAEVHLGFLEDFKSICVQVVNEVKAAIGKTSLPVEVYVTGHSLGGGMAIIGAVELHLQGIPIKGVYTFGQPRVGDETFCELYNALTLGDVTFRFVNANDIVPRSPGVALGYRHCGQEIFLPPFAKCWVVNPGWWRKCVCDFFTVFLCLKDHYLQAYETRIANLN